MLPFDGGFQFAIFRILTCILVGLFGASCFYSSLVGQFVFDDSEAIVNNADIKLDTPISNIFKNDFWGTRLTHNASHKSYRPLTVLSFRLNVWLKHGLVDPYGFHVFNIVLHGVASALTLPIFIRLFNTQSCSSTSLLASLLFATHPVHSEAVAGIVGRADLLCAVLCFSSLLLYCRATDTRNVLTSVCLTLLSSILAALAMLAKEQGITILAVCSFYDILIPGEAYPLLALKQFLKGLIHPSHERKDSKKQHNLLYQHLRTDSYNLKTVDPIVSSFEKIKLLLIRHSIVLICGSFMLYSRWWIMGFKTPTFQKVDNPASFADSTLIRVINYNYIYALNIWLLICPEWLCFDWSMGCVPLLTFKNLCHCDVRLLAVLIFWIILIIFIFQILKHYTISSNRHIMMAFVFMIVPFSVASNLLFRVGFVIAERVLYIPSVGFCMLISVGIHRLSNHIKMKSFLYLSVILLLAVNVSRCYQRSLDWKNERTLFSSGLNVCPLNAKVHYNLAKTSLNSTVAVRHYREAIRLHPEYEQAMNNLANILRDLGNVSEAENLLRKAVSIRPDFAAAWMNLGIVLSNMKRFDEALICYKTALQHRKNYPDCYYNLGNLFLSQNMYSEAYSAWRQATTQKPTHSIAWNNMIVMLDSIGKLDEAKSMGLEALTSLPKDSALHFNLANTLGKQGHYEEAEEHFKQAISLKPGQALYYTNLGVLYHRWKKYILAEEQYIIALKINQNLTNVVHNLKTVQKLISKMNLSNNYYT